MGGAGGALRSLRIVPVLRRPMGLPGVDSSRRPGSGPPRRGCALTEGRDRRDLLRLWPRATAATLLVAVCPLLIVYALETSGVVRSIALAVVLGSLVSAGLARIGSAVWARLAGAGDVVFRDLMIWGFITRLRSEKSRRSSTFSTAGEKPTRASIRLDGSKCSGSWRRLSNPVTHTHGHTHRVTRYSHMIAQAMPLSPAQINKIRTAAAVHDVGKLYVPRAIIDKRGRLTDGEFAVMKQHSACRAGFVDDAATHTRARPGRCRTQPRWRRRRGHGRHGRRRLHRPCRGAGRRPDRSRPRGSVAVGTSLIVRWTH